MFICRELGLKQFSSTIIGHGTVQSRVVKGLLTLIHQERFVQVFWLWRCVAMCVHVYE